MRQWVLGVILLTGCTSSTVVEKAEPASQLEPTKVEPAKLAEKAPSSDEVAELVCGGKNPCHVMLVQPTDLDGVFIAEVSYHPNPQDDGRWKDPDYDVEDWCHPWELYQVNVTKGDALNTRKIAYFCNDGYGASGVGEHFWDVKNGQIEVSTNGGSNWRWGQGSAMDLRNSTVTRVYAQHYFASAPDVFTWDNWDYESFSGVSGWSVMSCETEQVLEFEPRVIPTVNLPAAFSEGGWAQTGLGECASVFDASGSNGFVIHGATSSETDTQMKVVAGNDGQLFVEVLDDELKSSQTGNWIHADHLEVWVSTTEQPRLVMDCVEPQKPVLWQWGIDATDGQVHPAYGKPGPLKAEVKRFEGGTRFRVELPTETKHVTVVYSDSDDGKTQERLLATSPLKFGDYYTLGSFKQLDQKRVTCEVDGESLKRTNHPYDGLLGPDFEQTGGF